jgi:nucleotide-binding universal stress UspA family protein
MTTDTQIAPATGTEFHASTRGRFRHLFVPNVAYKLLLAIENDDNAPAAIRVTDALARRGALPTILRTMELMPAVAGTGDSMIVYTESVLGEEFYRGQEGIVVSTIRKVLGADRPWPVRAVVGEAASTIVSEAQSGSAEVLVIGIHHHGIFAQALGENTATRVMSHAGIPVIGVRPDTQKLPRRIMVATDFGDASVEAAHLAANLVNPDGTVILVHATLPTPIVVEGDEGAALVQRVGIEHAFLNLCADISKGRKIHVETITRTGDAATELLAAAEQVAPDMIATASQRHGFLDRLILGSVSRKIVRDGHWSMLVMPPAYTTEPQQ